MAVQLNHTIVSVRDKRESATFLAEILGLDEPTPYGPFLVVQVDNDVFSGYDGGWLTGVPYVITLVRGDGAVTYRIASRAQVRDGVRYALCPGGHAVCEQHS